MKYKIFYFIGSLNLFGGTERVLINKANYFADILDYDITIICYSINSDELLHFLSPKIKIIPISNLIPKPFFQIKWVSFLLLIYKIKKIYRGLISKNNPDFLIVLEKGFDDFIVSSMKTKAVRIRESHSSNAANGLIFQLTLKNIYKFLVHRIYISRFDKYDAVVLLTHRDKVHRGNRMSHFVIPNIIDFNTNLRPKLNVKKAISVGRLDKFKNHRDLISIWAEIVKTYPDWILDIYGDGIEFNNLKDQICKLKLQNNVFLRGQVSNIQELYVNYSVFLFTSLAEGFGMVLVEAMQSGLPVISYNCDCGPSEIVNDNVDGFLISVGDKKMFQSKIDLLLSDQDLLHSMSNNAILNSNRFRANIISQQWVSLFDKLYVNRARS
jgi:glycosyltransferase involved in cell wall biosynthesis